MEKVWTDQISIYYNNVFAQYGKSTQLIVYQKPTSKHLDDEKMKQEKWTKNAQKKEEDETTEN